MYKLFIRPLLFLISPEKVHHLVTGGLKLVCKLPGKKAVLKMFFGFTSVKLEREVFGIKFPNPVGLAAGFDKNAEFYEELACFGFGFIEIGTVTPLAQYGNPQPRMFRLPKDSGLINRMGFNNHGVEAAVKRLKSRNPNLIIGGNIGKNKLTPNEEATSDYEKCFLALHDYVDYFVVNVSSPNTPNLRDLQEKEPLTKLLSHLMKLNERKPIQKPILLKIAPDLTNSQLDDIVAIVADTKIAGVIATNTTIDRSMLKTDKQTIENIGAGGVSGTPAKKRSTEVINYLYTKSNGTFPIIGVGGIHSAEDALEKLDAGASLVQVFTGFIYEGPGLIKSINKRLAQD